MCWFFTSDFVQDRDVAVDRPREGIGTGYYRGVTAVVISIIFWRPR
jgi:hypothetical protein